MEIKVKSKNLRISPYKARPVLLGLRGQNAEKAKINLSFTNKKAATFVVNLLKSALAIAKENDLDEEKMMIKSIYCNEGTRLKRRQIKARGRADAIKKRMSHIELIISDELTNSEKDIASAKDGADTAVSDRDETLEKKEPKEKNTEKPESKKETKAKDKKDNTKGKTK